MNGTVRLAANRVAFAVAGTVWIALLPMLIMADRPVLAQLSAVAGEDLPESRLAADDSPLLLEPKSPEELFDAVVLLTDLARPRLAAEYLKRLVQSNPPDDAILKMREKHGPAAFLRLVNLPQLQPFANQLLDRMNAAYETWVRDPNRIGELVKELQADPAAREAAVLQLQSAGANVVPPLLILLADESQQSRNDTILYAMARMGAVIVPPLLAALDAPREDFKSTVIDLLGRIGSSEAVPHLWYYAFSETHSPGVQWNARAALANLLQAPTDRIARVSLYGVEQELRRQALNFLDPEYPWESTDNNSVPLWVWSPEENTVVRQNVPVKAAALFRAGRFARQALQLAPESSVNQSVYLGILLDEASYEAGWDKPLPAGPGTAHDLALLAGPDVVLQTLDQALRQGRPGVALPCLQILSQIASEGEMRLRLPRESAVLAAINFPDRRVQFAAATTVLQADPNQSFRGAHRVVEILTRALGDRGQSRGLVIDPNVDRAGRVAGFLNDMGYDSDTERTGMDGFRRAAENNDVELIAVHAAVIEWGLNQTIANLKADARTAGIPVVVYGPEMLRPKLEPMTKRFAQVTFVIESSSSADFEAQVRPFRDRLTTPELTAEQRRQQRLAAGYWLSHIATGNRTPVFDLHAAQQTLVAAKSDPELAIASLVTLGALPTNVAQQELAESAVNRNQPAAVRETAALQLAFHIQKHGLLLSEKAVTDIHASWRAATDPRISTALAGVIGSLKPNATLVGERLKAYPARVAPPTP